MSGSIQPSGPADDVKQEVKNEARMEDVKEETPIQPAADANVGLEAQPVLPSAQEERDDDDEAARSSRESGHSR